MGATLSTGTPSYSHQASSSFDYQYTATLRKQSSQHSDQFLAHHASPCTDDSLSLLKKLNICDLDNNSEDEEDKNLLSRVQDSFREDDEEGIEDHQTLFDDESIPMVKITTAPPLIEEETTLYSFQRMSTFNNAYEQRYFKQDFDCSVTLQIPEIKVDPPFQRSRTGNQDKRPINTVRFNSDYEEEEEEIKSQSIVNSRSSQECEYKINLNSNSLFAFCNDSQLAQVFCSENSGSAIPNDEQQSFLKRLSFNDNRSSQHLSAEHKSHFLSIPEVKQDTLDSLNRQNSHKSSASILKSQEDGSDDSFTSINTDIQNTIINELQSHQDFSKQSVNFGRQGTYGHKKEDKVSLVMQSKQHENEEANKGTLQNPYSNPFMRSLTSRTQYQEVMNEDIGQKRYTNMDEESLFTEEDHCEQFSGSFNHNQESTEKEVKLKISKDNNNSAYLSPLRILVNKEHINQESFNDHHQLNHSPRSWGGTVSSPLLNSSWTLSPQHIHPQQQQQLFPPSAQQYFMGYQPIKAQMPSSPLNNPNTSQIQQQQYLAIAPFYPSSGFKTPQTLNPNSIAFERQTSSVSNNSSNSSHASQKSRTSAVILINQAYKNLKTQEEKSQFLIQNAVILVKDQNGCRRIQKRLDDTQDGQKFAFQMLNQLMDSIADLMMDSFANYLCQKLVNFANDEQIDRVLEKVQPHFVKIALNKHGTRALQNFLTQIVPLNDSRSKLISDAIKYHVLEMSLNLHGNHVIQICIDHFSQDLFRQPIYQTVLQHCGQIATDKHGCCVIQKLLGNFPYSVKEDLIKQSLTKLNQIINDQYGNYVVQQVLKYQNQNFNMQVVDFICKNFIFYCTQKISSNVVEQAIRGTSHECQKAFFSFLMKNGEALQEIMLDQYGNYVAQAIFQKSYDFQDQTYFNYFYDLFNQSLEDLKRVSFGKKLIQKISDKQPDYFSTFNTQETGFGQLKRQNQVKKSSNGQKFQTKTLKK